jgi:predicted nucleic acid-binding protein
MADFYFDSSALVKQYCIERGSSWVFATTARVAGNTIILSEITLAEVAAALSAKARGQRGLSLTERDRAFSRFLQDCQSGYILLPVDRGVIDLAVALTLRYPLRGYDAVQLATALSVSADLTSAGRSPLTFVSSDNDLLAAANAEGLPTADPSTH